MTPTDDPPARGEVPSPHDRQRDVRRLAKAVQPLLQLAEHSETFVEEHQRRHETF